MERRTFLAIPLAALVVPGVLTAAHPGPAQTALSVAPAPAAVPRPRALKEPTEALMHWRSGRSGA